MDTFKLRREQLRLAKKIILNDSFSEIKTVGAAACLPVENKVLACVIVCEFPSLILKEKKTFLLPDPFPYVPGFEAYREMPAIISAYDLLEEEPDVLLVKGAGILHPRKCGLASHLGLALQQATIGIDEKLVVGKVEEGKIVVDHEVRGFEIKTKEFANSLYVSPGNLVSLGSVLKLIPPLIKYPHKLPEPLHLAQKLAKRKVQALKERKEETKVLEKNKPQTRFELVTS